MLCLLSVVSEEEVEQRWVMPGGGRQLRDRERLKKRRKD